MNEPTLSFSGPGPGPAPTDFGVADALAAVRRDGALLEGVRDFAERTKAYETLTAGQRHIWRTRASDKKANLYREALLSFGDRGVGPEAWFDQNALRWDEEAPPGSATVASPPPPRAAPNPLVPPKPRPDPDLKGPSTLQLAAGGLFALLAPKYAALALAAPFQEGLRQHAQDVERTRSENEDAFRRWRDGFPDRVPGEANGAARKASALGAPVGDEPSPAGPGRGEPGTTVPGTPVPGTPVPGSGAADRGARIRQMWASGKFAAASAEAYKVRGELLQGRLRWADRSQAGRIAKDENDAEYSRRKAYDMAAGTRERASFASLNSLAARLEDAGRRTRRELDSLQAQEASLRSLAERGPDPHADDLERIRTLRMVRLDDLRRLGELAGQTRSRLESMGSGAASASSSPRSARPGR